MRFLLLIFSLISYPPAPEYPIRTVSNFFRKFAEIFASQGAPQVLTTAAAMVPPVLLVLLIPAANLPPESTTPTANLPPVSMTPVANNRNNIRLLRP